MRPSSHGHHEEPIQPAQGGSGGPPRNPGPPNANQKRDDDDDDGKSFWLLNQTQKVFIFLIPQNNHQMMNHPRIMLKTRELGGTRE